MTFYSGSLNDGKKFVDYITNALWTIDENHSQINKAAANGDCQPLPDLFNEIYSTEYNYWRQLKKAKPTLCFEKLMECSDNLFDQLTVWHNKKFPSKVFLDGCVSLAEYLRSYADMVKKVQNRMANVRSTTDAAEKFNLPSSVMPID